MGVVCTNSNKPKKHKTTIYEYEVEDHHQIDKINSKKSQNETNYNITNHNKSLGKIIILEDIKFYIETYEKNEYFITSNFENLKYFSTTKKYYSKWEEILQFTRPQKKFSYRNLNQNHNFIISNNEKKNSHFKNTNSTNNHQDNLSYNIEEINNTNNIHTKISVNKSILGRGSQITNYVGKNSDYSNLIQKFQIAFFFNKYRYIKYLSKGPPNNIRWTIWVSLALCQSGHDFVTQEKYIELINKIDKNFETYEEEQIKKDLNRSNQNTEFFSNKQTLNSLYNILKALAIEDPELGYCQGMNILAANFLMISDGNEFETFNMLRFFFKHLELREFFLNGFPKLIMFIFILKEFIKDNLPKLFIKISELEVPEETWIFKWLQTLYSLTLPLSITIRLIDCVLCFGLEFLLNFSLGFIKFFEKKLMQCEDINDFLKTFKVEEIINPNIIINNVLSCCNSQLEDFNKKENKSKEFERTFSNNFEAVNNFINSNSTINNLENKNNNIFKKLNIYANKIENINENNNEQANINSNINKLKKQETSCFNFNISIKQSKESENINNNQIMNTKSNKEENIKAIEEKSKNLLSPLKTNNDDKKSDLGTTFHSSIKYLINTKDELLSFREKLITNAKKIDLKDAIKKMMENYSKENMDVKNKFNDNDSSTGDGINEDKSVVYDNEDINKKGIGNKSPFEISYKNPEKETSEHNNFNENDNLENNKLKSERVSNNNLIMDILERKSIRKTSKNSAQDIINEIIFEEKDYDTETYNIRSSNNLDLKKDNVDKYRIEAKVSSFFNKKKICNNCLFKTTNKYNDNFHFNNLSTFNNNRSSNSSNKNSDSKEENCNFCKDSKESIQEKSKSSNFVTKKVKIRDFYYNDHNEEESELKPNDLKVDLYLEDANLKHDINEYIGLKPNIENENHKVNPFKKNSKNDLRLSNINESTDKINNTNKNNYPYSCKNVFYSSNQTFQINSSNVKNNEIGNNSISPNDKSCFETPDNFNKMQSTTKNTIRNFFSFNFQNNPHLDLHRFSWDNSNNPNINSSRVLTVEQISLMNNIKEKLDLIKNFDYLDIEENENDEDNNELLVNENFDSDIEWENRSKINRNINEGGTNIKKISEIYSPDRVKKLKFLVDKEENNINNNKCDKNANRDNSKISKLDEKNNYKVNVLNLENEKELNLEENSFDKHELNSLYENSYYEFNDTINKSYNNELNKNKEKNSTFHSRKNSNISSNINLNNEVDKNNNQNNNLTEISKGNSVSIKTEKPNRKNNLMLNLNSESNTGNIIKYKNSTNSIEFFKKMNTPELNDFNRSMNDMKSNNEKIKKKNYLIRNLGIETNRKEDLNGEENNEKTNFLHIRVNSSNKSLIKVNLNTSNNLKTNVNINVQSNNKKNGYNNIKNQDENLEKETKKENLENIIKNINLNTKIQSNDRLPTLEDETINNVSDEYSTHDKKYQNTKNIKDFDNISLIKKKNSNG